MGITQAGWGGGEGLMGGMRAGLGEGGLGGRNLKGCVNGLSREDAEDEKIREKANIRKCNSNETGATSWYSG